MHEYEIFDVVNGSADYPNSGIGYADVVGVNVRKTNSKKKTFGIRLLL